MNFKRFHESKNLLSEKYENRSINGAGAFTIDNTYDLWLGEVVAGQTYAISNMNYVYGFFTAKPLPNTGATYDGSRGYETSGTAVVTVPSGCTWIAVRVSHNADNAMLNTGSQPLPYEPYSSEVWHDIPHYVHKTDTDILTTLPADIYPAGTTATVGLKGQTLQSSVPSPTSPVMPQGTGERTGNLFDITKQTVNNQIVTLLDFGEDKNYPLISLVFEFSNTIAKEKNAAFIDLLEDNGTHHYITLKALRLSSTGGTDSFPLNEIVNNTYYASFANLSFRYIKMYLYTSSYCSFSQGDIKTAIYDTNRTDFEPYGYKIPISSASTTTPVYLGGVESTRRIKKLVLTGNEDITATTGNAPFVLSLLDIIQVNNRRIILFACSHYEAVSNSASWSQYNSCVSWSFSGGINVKSLVFRDTSCADVDAFKTYLAQQYANGTPVTIWYVLAEPTTGIVNEPLMRIGDYADEVSGISIPTIAGANSFDVLTTLKPSEVTVNYKGWHPVTAVHERESGSWD